MAHVTRIDNDVLNFLRRAHRMIDDIQQEAGDDAAARLHEVGDTIIEQLRGAEVACACHVFGSVALARVLRVCTDAQRSILIAPLLAAPDPLTLVRRATQLQRPTPHSNSRTPLLAAGVRQVWLARLRAGLVIH